MENELCTCDNGKQSVELHADQRLTITEQMFDERRASDYIEKLSDMLHHYLYTPRKNGTISPEYAAETTHTVHRLIKHITALSETIRHEQQLAA